MSELPEWVKRHKKPGIAIEERNGRYYATRVKSVWDPNKGRARKITVEYLGVVTPEGIIPPKHKRPVKVGGIREAGHVLLLNHFAKPLLKPLQQYWPDTWQSILAAAVLKLIYLEPFKRLSFHYETSYASQLWPDAALSKNSITQLLEKLGSDWGAQRCFFEDISQGNTHIAIDLTQIFSASYNISWLEKGYNAEDIFYDQFQILLLWSIETHLPAFLKILPGTASSARNLLHAVYESNLRNVTVVGDKGFFSDENVRELEEAGVHYILALKRDTQFIEYPSATQYKNYFLYRDRAQWWRERMWKGRRVVVYLDKVMAGEEETMFLKRVEEGRSTMKEYRKHRNWFGTLALLTDTGMDAKELYEMYKTRREIEYAFDGLKNTLECDKTWIQSRESLQGYFFIHFISLYLYSQVLEHLRRKDLLQRYSVRDVLCFLSKVYTVDVNGKQVVGEITNSTRELIDALEIPITKNLGSQGA